MKAEIITAITTSRLQLPLFSDICAAGFPLPAQDYIEAQLDLNDFCTRHPSATHYVHALGESMVEVGILSGDLLVVNRALTPSHGDTVIAAIDGESTLKRLCTLLAANEQCLQPDICRS